MMSEISMYTALELLKIRLNRADEALEDYLATRVKSATESLERIGITLTDRSEDIMLVVDMAAWQYQNRDKPGTMPEWLRLMRRERWLGNEVKVAVNDP